MAEFVAVPLVGFLNPEPWDLSSYQEIMIKMEPSMFAFA